MSSGGKGQICVYDMTIFIRGRSSQLFHVEIWAKKKSGYINVHMSFSTFQEKMPIKKKLMWDTQNCLMCLCIILIFPILALERIFL
jgi:hypothetical protein